MKSTPPQPRDGFTWSIHRPHTIIGYALGNAMNMGVTLAVERHRSAARPATVFFPGSPAQWNGLTDMTDARLLARHLEWASTTPQEQPSLQRRQRRRLPLELDVVSPRRMVRHRTCSVRPAKSRLSSSNSPTPLPSGEHRQEIHISSEPDLYRLVSAWHTDADLGRPIEVVTDMSKSRKLGFLDYQPTDESFFDLFTTLRTQHIIP